MSAYGRIPRSLALSHLLQQYMASKRVAGHTTPHHGHNPVRTPGEFLIQTEILAFHGLFSHKRQRSEERVCVECVVPEQAQALSE